MEKGNLIVNSGGYRVLNSYMVLGVTIKREYFVLSLVALWELGCAGVSGRFCKRHLIADIKSGHVA